ncbi:MAG: hypothetical protein BWY41_01642 [Candidatus Atribacteria bacterium ADurb.Bin276]|uniref:Uncharacterized protein n=1 Tax=Candidatus Atribacter allofermentans TaxID=1852833 RepID=A0A1V5SMC7_9BACT|nr:MAG: hypothetical protein BWY41_01642 [Candidatus Atribacteria bacterium ADurb.Bin276]
MTGIHQIGCFNNKENTTSKHKHHIIEFSYSSADGFSGSVGCSNDDRSTGS